ncbi:T9SS type A sorting domain-containing protein [Dyadobacter arcticus]|uniref:Por secretion system C-terminal sorting domain-containing protein n=1 Tax=Dyadobacter arcticus TaxID=1078754 RepID=A0ABX0UUH7_9BACT|nr:T9SS type A sorting domain-containing protein [Dyadobacter arcticus]NIJ55455.1 hypothetical protein [Dyadobacter arcticus]
MKKVSLFCLTFVWLALVMLSQSLSAQCPTADLTLSNQFNVNNFATNYPGCSHLTQSLYIDFGDIADLSPLSGIRRIDGNLSLGYLNNLTNLNGLHNLISVGGQFDVIGMNQLVNLTGLNQLVSVGSDFRILSNTNLVNLNGLNALVSIGGGLDVEQNQKLNSLAKLSSITSVDNLYISGTLSLASLSGLHNITSVNGAVDISDNAGLLNLDALSGLTTIAEDVVISGNPLIANLGFLSQFTSISADLSVTDNAALNSLDGLQNITSVGGSLTISENPLTSLNALSKLTSVGEELRLEDCSLLTNLSGLEKLTSPIEHLSITGNPLLTDISALAGIKKINSALEITFNSSLANCALQVICQAVSGGLDYIYISDNTGSCATQTAVESACTALPVTLVRFDAKKESRATLLSWETTVENNSSHFVIEKSSERRISWNEIGSVRSAGESKEVVRYSFIDAAPFTGKNLYRLKMIDTDGSFAFSRILNLEFEQLETVVYPNPASNFLYVEKTFTGTPLEITNSGGVIVWSGTANLGMPLDISSLQKGLHVLRTRGKSIRFLIRK